MAHAGTPTGLAQQPAASESLWKLLLKAVVILAIGFALAMAATFLINRTTSVPAADRSYDQIEAQRAATSLSAVAGDRSYDQVEKARGATILSGTWFDRSLDQMEMRRGVTTVSGPSVDRSQDEIEARRGATTLP